MKISGVAVETRTPEPDDFRYAVGARSVTAPTDITGSDFIITTTPVCDENQIVPGSGLVVPYISSAVVRPKSSFMVGLTDFL
jgi:hypothetical protein